VKQRVFLGGLLVALKRAGFSFTDVQSDVLLPSWMHLTTFSIDQQYKQYFGVPSFGISVQ